jgi:hypothetical protein
MFCAAAAEAPFAARQLCASRRTLPIQINKAANEEDV